MQPTTNPNVTAIVAVATLALVYLLWTHGGQTIAAGLAVLVANAYFLHSTQLSSSQFQQQLLQRLFDMQNGGTTTNSQATFLQPNKTSSK